MTRNLDQGPWPSTVRLKLKDGRIVESTVLSPKGDPATPLSNADLKNKILGLTRGFLEPAHIDRIHEITHSLEQIDNLGKFIDTLVVSS
jgi:2-methylcitrate dehydratase PrpD